MRASIISCEMSDGSLDDGDAIATSRLPLALSGNNDDPEGLDIRADGSWWVSTEGNANANDANNGGFEPFVGRVNSAGVVVEELPLPAAFDPIAPNGIRHNRGFEGVALMPNGGEIFTGAEEGLSQDELTGGGSELTRLFRFDLATGQAIAEYPYLLDNTPGQKGLVALLSTGGDSLLALERAVGIGFDVRLFEVDVSAAGDVSGRTEIGTD